MIGGLDLARMLADPESGLVMTPIIDADSQIGKASIDIRLGPDIIVSKRATGAVSFDASDPQAFREALRRRQTYVRRGIGDPFHLQPGEFAIARSLEYVQLPDDVSAEALGRSSWGRLGLTIATATLIDPGFRGTITLELSNVGNTPMVLEVGLCIAQLTFSRDESSVIRAKSAAKPRRNLDSTGAPNGDACQREQEERTARVVRAEKWWSESRSRRKPSRYSGQMRPELSKLDDDSDLLWVSPMAVKYAVGVVGHRFAGKSTVVNFLTSRRGFRLYRLARFVYEEALRRGENIGDKETLRRVAGDMRNRWGNDVLARMAFARIRSDYLDVDRSRQPASIVIEGFKRPEELAAWQRLDFFRTVLVETPPLQRLERGLASGLLDDVPARSEIPDDAAARREWLGEHGEEWLRAHVDECEDGRLPAQPVIDAAQSHSSRCDIDNGEFSVSRLNDVLKERVSDLDLWSRSRPY